MLMTSSSSSSLPSVIFENAGNDINDEAYADASDTKSCLSSKIEGN